jgi:uncharacterized protein (TIGR03437 family)
LFIRWVFILAVVCRAQGIITTFAGNGMQGFTGNGGPAINAALGAPTGVTVDPAGNVYFAEQINDVIRIVNAAANINTFAGCNPTTSACLVAGLGNGGPATGAFLNPVDVLSDKLGNIYFTDSGKSLVRMVSTTGILSTIAGNGTTTYSGDGVAATSAAVNGPIGMAFDSAGNLYIADTLNNRIRKVSAATGIISTFAGNGIMGFGGDGAAATSATLANPHSIAFDSAGNLYISDTLNHRIRMVDMNGHMNTIAGNGMVGNTGDGGQATSATMTNPWGIAVDSSGNIYFADSLNNTIRKINAAGVISTIAGGGKVLGDGGPAIIATLSAPEGIALDGSGNLYIADYSNNRIRKVSGVTSGGGEFTTPVITSVGNAESGTTIIAPNTWMEINGANLAPAGDIRAWGTADFVNGQLPTSLDGVSVTVNGVSAYVNYISPTQVNILTPPEAIQGSIMVQLTTAGVASAPFPVQAQIVSPALFVFNGGPYVAAEHPFTYSYIGPTTLYPGLTTPAAPGETIMIYGNGFGATSVNVVAGSETQTGNLPTVPIVTIGGQPVTTVTFAGLVFPGEYLFNVVVPGGLADGDHAITMMYGGVETQPGVLLTTKQ